MIRAVLLSLALIAPASAQAPVTDDAVRAFYTQVLKWQEIEASGVKFVCLARGAEESKLDALIEFLLSQRGTRI